MPARARRRAPAPTALASNQVRLAERYGLQWSVPAGAPAADVDADAAYVGEVALLLAGGDGAAIPRGAAVRILDLGGGAGCVRAFVAASEYGWRCVVTNRDQAAHRWGRQIVRINRPVAALIEGRHQTDPRAYVALVTTPGERFAACLYDPSVDGDAGREGELVERLIAESAARPSVCVWFTARVSTKALSQRLRRALAAAGAGGIHDLVLPAGPPRRHVLAWTFAQPV